MQTALHNLDINKLNTLRARTRTLFFVTLGITKLIITQVCVHLNLIALNNKLHQIFLLLQRNHEQSVYPETGTFIQCKSCSERRICRHQTV